jgi:serine/threonine protein kinase
VLLKSAGGDDRGFVAKVSDFGLSMRIDPSETHVSNFYQGTLTHMAPEVLMYGKLGFASDVYAYGIILWEMYTAQQAFKGIPRALLGHDVAKLGRRPEFPPDCPFDYQLLACRCWESDPAIR